MPSGLFVNFVGFRGCRINVVVQHREVFWIVKPFLVDRRHNSKAESVAVLLWEDAHRTTVLCCFGPNCVWNPCWMIGMDLVGTGGGTNNEVIMEVMYAQCNVVGLVKMRFIIPVIIKGHLPSFRDAVSQRFV